MYSDVMSNRKMLQMILKKRLGAAVTFETAVDGVDAIDTVSRVHSLDPIDIVFLDNMMPNMNGKYLSIRIVPWDLTI